MEKERDLFTHVLDRELHEGIYHKTKESLFYIKFELKKQVILAVTAALVFLIAISWKDPIQNTFILLVEKIGWGINDLFLEYLSAILITIIAVLILFLINSKIIKSISLEGKKVLKKK